MGAGYLGQRDNAASSHGGALKHHQPLRGKTRAEAVPWPPSFANRGPAVPGGPCPLLLREFFGAWQAPRGQLL